ncbi:MAG: ROK family protein [Candidatus Limnocylindrales bacterium]
MDGPRRQRRGPSARSSVIAVDLGASRLRVAVIGPDGSISERVERATRVADGPAAVIADAIGLIDAIRAPDRARAAARGRSSIVAIGIGAPGPVDPIAGRLLEPPNLGPAFRDVPLAAEIAAATGLPTALDRDTNVALLGECAFGAAKGARHAIYLTVSTGVGGAVLADGRLLAGASGLAGELGHVVVDLDGPLCGCGARGHLEAYSSGVGIARAARAAIERGTAPGLADIATRIGPQAISARDVAEAEERVDADAAAIMDLARRAFAAALVGMVDVFAPEVIVVGGGIAMAQGERLLGPARDAVRATAFRSAASLVRIVPAALGDDVGLVGALALVRARGGLLG